MRSKLMIITAMVSLLFSPLSQAHLLKVFAWSEGSAVAGNAYFSGGIPAKGARIQLKDASGNVLVTGHPNAKGDFHLEVPPNTVAVQVIADTNDGHIAHWSLKTAAKATKPKSKAMTTKAQTSTANIDQQQLKQLVAEAVAEQIGPLRMELDKDASAFRLSDILGGIGYIFGVFGILIWLKSRKTVKQ